MGQPLVTQDREALGPRAGPARRPHLPPPLRENSSSKDPLAIRTSQESGEVTRHILRTLL